MHPLRWLERRLARWFPRWSYSGDRLFVSARRAMVRAIAGVLAFVLGLVGVLLLDAEWRGVLAGALLAWSVSIVAWAVSSYSAGRADTLNDLRRNAELDVLHGRLNLISAKLEVPVIDLDMEWEHAVQARIERLAHFAGLDEFRLLTHAGPGQDFWTAETLGRHD